MRQLQGLMPGTSGSEALAGSAAYCLRKAALRDDGTLDPAKFATWRNSHAEALGALPPGVGQAFDTAARATAALDRFGKFTPDLPTSKIPSLFFNPGPAGADGVRMLRSLTDDDTASHLLGDYAAFSLQSKAIGEDGGFNAKAARNWMAAHKPALDALPAEVGQRFKTVAEAHEAVADAVAAKKASVEAFNDTAAAKLAGVEDPDEVVKRLATILKAPDATAQMRSLVKAAGDDDAAVAGLKRAAAEVVKGKALSVNEAGTSGVNQMTNSGFRPLHGTERPGAARAAEPGRVRHDGEGRRDPDAGQPLRGGREGQQGRPRHGAGREGHGRRRSSTRAASWGRSSSTAPRPSSGTSWASPWASAARSAPWRACSGPRPSGRPGPPACGRSTTWSTARCSIRSSPARSP